MAHQHHAPTQPVDDVGNVLGIAMHVGQRQHGCPVTGQVHSQRGDAASVQLGLQRSPAPCAMPRTVNEDDERITVRVQVGHRQMLAHPDDHEPPLQVDVQQDQIIGP